MLDAKPSFERIALNRVTFGARDLDVALTTRIGWSAWVNEQLSPPPGDDPELAQHIAAQRMHIEYPAEDYSFAGTVLKWDAVKEDRPLNYLSATLERLYHIAVVRDTAFAEITRVQQEQVASLWIRNAHSHFQVREFLTDFWLNHFSMNREKGNHVATTLLSFERDVIRPNVLGNFRTLLGAVASSPAMLLYLDNADSQAVQPNENYARELMELHTMGRGAYFGKDVAAAEAAPRVDGYQAGFTDQDIVHASRALSGWTIKRGQYNGEANYAVATGAFVFNPYQHNGTAERVLGVDLRGYEGQAQGERVLDIVARHPATADFICTKLCKRIFGDAPPQAAIDRAKAAWLANRDQPDQIKRVMSAILLDGPEIGTGPQVKVRRPYERVLAMFRTTDTVVNADPWYFMALDNVNDTPFIWASPDGRPDTNAFWLNTYTQVTMWNFLKQIPHAIGIQMRVFNQPPATAMKSVPALMDYWVDRMVGAQLGGDSASILSAYAQDHGGPLNNEFEMIEKVIYMIACCPEFTVR